MGKGSEEGEEIGKCPENSLEHNDAAGIPPAVSFLPQKIPEHHDAAGHPPAVSYLPRKIPRTPRRGGKPTRRVVSSPE